MHTFALSEAAAADARLEQVPVEAAVKARIGAPVLQWASNLGSLVGCRGNSFVHAAHLAFAEHLPLVISPDDVWLCLVQGLGIHLNLGAESLRHAVVAHKGKLKIRLRRDDFVWGSPTNDWTGVFDEFSRRLDEHLGPKSQLIVGGFSTTGRVERAVAQIALMSAVQNYFDYSVSTLCGIRRITLLGTVDDWKSVRRRALVFAEFDMAAWTAALLPVLDQFVAAAGGHVDHSFWRCFYKWNEASGGDVVSGWINVLFPFTVTFDSGTERFDDVPQVPMTSGPPSLAQLKRFRTRHVSNPHALESECLDGVGPRDSAFPSGLCQAPLCWQYLGEDHELDVVGGFVGVSQDQQTLAVRPAIGWAVCERTSEGDSPGLAKPVRR